MNCPKCGAENPDGSKFCAGCGGNMEETSAKQSAGQPVQASQNNYSAVGANAIGTRNIALCVLFSIITCGIYGFYWIYKINQEVNSLSKHEFDTSGGLVIIFSIITCGVYNTYWAYKIGAKIRAYYKNNGSEEGKELAILYLVLMLANYLPFGFCALICKCLMQDKINKIVENR